MNQERRQTLRRSAVHGNGVRCFFCCKNGNEVIGLIAMNEVKEFIHAACAWKFKRRMEGMPTQETELLRQILRSRSHKVALIPLL